MLVVVRPPREPDKPAILDRLRAEHSFFLKKCDVSDDLRRMLRDWHETLGIDDQGDWLRVRWRNYDSRASWVSTFAKRNIQTYEGDVNPVLRWTTDNVVQIARPRGLYLDFETDSRLSFSRKLEMRILSAAVVDADTGWERTIVLRSDTDKAERDLLAELWSIIDRYDRVMAWNGDRFDFPILKARSIDLHGFQVEWRRWLWLDHLECFRRMNMMAAESGAEKQSMRLEDVCQEVLKEGKDPFDASKTYEAWKAGGTERERMRRYNLKDANLMRRLEGKTGYIELLQTLAETCGTFGDSRGINPSIQVDGFMQRIARERGYKFPTKRRLFNENLGKYKGAYVVEPRQTGITRNVHVCDFKSMYPSIIISWNMSPETKLGRNLKPMPSLDVSSYSPLTGTAFDTREIGILPEALGELLGLRAFWSDRKAAAAPGTDEAKEADRRSTAYKVAANSFYGVIGMAMSRFFDRDVAEGITQVGKWMLEHIIEEAESLGMGVKVIGGDTDACFVTGCTRQEFAAFVEWCNTILLPRLLKSVGCKKNAVYLDFEKTFERIVVMKKKRYVGRWAFYKGKEATADSKPEIKGIEWKRGDSVRMARDIQTLIVDLLVGPVNGGVEDPLRFEAILHDVRERCLNGDLGLEDVMLSKRLNRELDGYVRRHKKDGEYARQLPHLELARELELRGFDVGEGAKVDYYIADGGVKPAKVRAAVDWDGQFDRHALWEGLVARPALRILEAAFPGHSWKQWAKSRPPKPRAPRAKRGAAGASGATPAPTPAPNA